MSDFNIPENLEAQQDFNVTKQHSAAHLGSGTISVLSTPSMILFMEITSRDALEKILPDGFSSVGIEVNIRHLQAVKIGNTVTATINLNEIDRKKLIFNVRVEHGDNILGSGTHTRFIINENDFLKSLE